MSIFAGLRQASFNGIPFWVETGDVEAGHRVSTTPIPNGRHVNEAFGPAARKFEVTAYVVGDGAAGLAAALLAAAEDNHLGVLVLPDSGAHRVRLTKAKRTFARDKLGYIAVALEAVAEPGASGGLSAAALEAQAYAAAAAAAVSLGSYSGAAFALAGQPSTVTAAAAVSAAQALGDLHGLASAMRLSPAGEAVVAPALSAAWSALSLFPSDPAGFGSALGTAAIALGDAADPSRLATVLIELGAPSAPPASPISQGPAVAAAANADVAASLAAAARALALGEAQARRIFADRREAAAARALAQAVFDDALSRIGRAGLHLSRELSALGAVLSDLASRREADLAPLVTVKSGRPLPALWWAWRLYADPGRALEIATRARVPHPGFMPERFEALGA